MASFFSTEGLARRSSRRPWAVIGIWVLAIVVAAGIAGSLLSGVLTTQFDFTNTPESKRAQNLLEDRLRGPRPINEIVIVRNTSATVDDSPAFQKVVEGVYKDVTSLSVVAGGTNFYQSKDPGLVSKDRHSTIIPLTMAGDIDDAADNIPQVHETLGKFQAPPGYEVMITGGATIGQAFQDISEEDLQTGETFGGVVALIILVLVFGAVVAALIPVALAVLSIIVALGLSALVGQAFDLSFFVTNMITMIGLAVGIDYSLFVVQRYREERAKGLEKAEAIAKAGSTASRAVLFSGTTVVLALLGMLLVPSTVFRSLGVGAILVVLVSILASLTLLPAVLSLLGDRINKLSLPWVKAAQEKFDEEGHGGFWDRASKAVMRRPVISLAIGVAILAAAAVPYFSINTGFAGIETFPEDLQVTKAFNVLQTEFSGGLVSPIEVVVDGQVNSPSVKAGIDRFAALIRNDPEFGAPTVTPNKTGDLALISFPLSNAIESRAAARQVERIRKDIVPQAGIPATVLVGGEPAGNLDFFNMSSNAVIPVFAFVLGMSFILLMLVFRSIVVPIKAVILNLLSVGAAYGILVLVFQNGALGGLFQQVDTIEAWLPLFLFSVLFGLSMDYHVFLLSRIRERYDQTNDNVGSVAFGIRSTGRLITGAALIMVAVFGGFATGRLVSLAQMGFGLAIAVLIDATIVRMVLVPAGMRLLGKWNWYLPTWLKWLPDLRVEAAERPLVVQGAAPEPGPASPPAPTP